MSSALAQENERIALSSNEIISIAHHQLLQALQGLYVRAEINPVNSPPDIHYMHGQFTWKAHFLATNPVRKRVCVWVDLYLDNKFYQEIPVWFAVSASQQTWVANSPIESHTAINTSYFTKTIKEVAGLSSSPVKTLSAYKNVWTKYALHAGEILQTDLLEPIPAVQLNQEVIVETINGRVRITTHAIALRAARIGDHILVRSISSGDLYTVKVVQPGMVQTIG